MPRLPITSSGRVARLVDHYAVLGIASAASFREVQQAYWRRAFSGQHAVDREALNAAYDVLGDEARRREYDELRAEAGLDEVVVSKQREQPVRSVDPGLRGKLGWPSI